VIVAPVAQRDVPLMGEWLGTTEGVVDAEIRAQVEGYLVSRDYREGTFVKQGDLLFRIDPRTLRAALDQARGDLGRAGAKQEQARLDVERYAPLVEQGAVSRQEYDNAVQRLFAAKAEVQSARAAVEKAEVDLSFTEIRSPIEGVAGIARGQLGNLVGPSDPEPLTAVSQIDPIVVAFPISEAEYLRYAARFRTAAQGDAAPREANLDLLLTDGSLYAHKGIAFASGREIDPRTGTIVVKASFPNPDFLLRPGQYARVRVAIDVIQGALLVPQRAVLELQGTHQVAVVKQDDTVEIRVVQPGPRDGSDWVIEKGLQPGERIVVEGVQKVRNGMAVKPTPAGAAATATGSS
jgi:membrane fusion protein (multidrug efflux system)